MTEPKPIEILIVPVVEAMVEPVSEYGGVVVLPYRTTWGWPVDWLAGCRQKVCQVQCSSSLLTPVCSLVTPTCSLQAQILCSPAGELGPGVPHNPRKAIELYQKVCDEGDSMSCFTLASMLLRGDKISKEADNVSPQEARGVVPLEQRTNEANRARKANDTKPIPRDPKRAEELLLRACITGSHATSCHNLAVMYTHGDDGVPADPLKAEEFQQKTDEMVRQFGGFF